MREGVIHHSMDYGVAVIFSDCHYWPGVISTAHRALVKMLPALRPSLVVANGDIIDGARISRHPRIGWDNTPKLRDELATAQQRLQEIAGAAQSARLVWPLGNHDARFETFLAAKSPEYEGVPGFTLKEHFPQWEPCWALEIGKSAVVKHRWKGGKTATLKNTIEAGKSLFTGHLHASRVSPYTDYNGTRYGVDGGTMADPLGPQFVNYTEANPLDWRQSFAVATWRNGILLPPELVEVIDETHVAFRGELIKV